MSRKAVFAAAAILALNATAWAGEDCNGIATHDIPPDKNDGVAVHKGDLYTIITQYRVDKQNGNTFYCLKGASCIPAGSIQLLNCKPGSKIHEDNEELLFSMKITKTIPGGISDAAINRAASVAVELSKKNVYWGAGEKDTVLISGQSIVNEACGHNVRSWRVTIEAINDDRKRRDLYLEERTLKIVCMSPLQTISSARGHANP